LVYTAKALTVLLVLSPPVLAVGGLAAEALLALIPAVLAVAEAVVVAQAEVMVLPALFGLSGLAVHAAHLHSPRLT
jgi:hypothetical protein